MQLALVLLPLSALLVGLGSACTFYTACPTDPPPPATSGGSNGTGGTGGTGGSPTCEDGAEATEISGHPHEMEPVPAGDITAATMQSYDVTGSGHMHTVTLTPAQYAMLANGMSITVRTDEDENNHGHDVTISCV